MATLHTRRTGTEDLITHLSSPKRPWCSTHAKGVLVNLGPANTDHARSYSLLIPFDEIKDLAEHLTALHNLHQRNVRTVTNSTHQP